MAMSPRVLQADCCPAAPARARTARSATARDADLAALAKALGHPARIRILRLLAVRTTCVCGSLVDRLDLAQSTVSEHLAVLKRAGLVRGTIDGPRTCYCIDPDGLARLKALVAGL